MLLLATACPCGKEHPGASPGCLGNPAAGCTWAAAPRTDDMRRQAALAAVILGKKLTDAGREMPVDLWRWLVQLDAAIATEWQISRRGACVCGRDLDDRGRHDHDPSRPWAAAGRRRHSHRTQSRNEPCACGSGLKFKHCHGR